MYRLQDFDWKAWGVGKKGLQNLGTHAKIILQFILKEWDGRISNRFSGLRTGENCELL